MTRSVMTRSPSLRASSTKAAELRVVVTAIRVAEAGVEPERVSDRVEAAGVARLVERVEVDPVEVHRRDARQFRGPGRDRSDQQREQVVDARTGPDL
jgi:hypothetical protein